MVRVGSTGLGLRCLIGGQPAISWIVSRKMYTFLFVRNQVGGGLSRGHILSLDVVPNDLTSKMYSRMYCGNNPAYVVVLRKTHSLRNPSVWIWILLLTGYVALGQPLNLNLSLFFFNRDINTSNVSTPQDSPLPFWLGLNKINCLKHSVNCKILYKCSLY